MKKSLVAVMFSVLSFPLLAATQTVTLAVPSMHCALCPITVKAALSRVDGVATTEASFETREVVVTFDDAKADVQQLIRATTEAGYPASVKQ